jgi:hypothetical protein
MSRPHVLDRVLRLRSYAGRRHGRGSGLVPVLAIACAVVAGCGSDGTKQPRDPDPPRPPIDLSTTTQAVLICWDGAQMRHTLDLMWRGALPNLRALRGEGGLAATTITTHPTETVSAHAEMLTGYPPTVTGVHSLVECRPIPRELTLFYRVKRHLGPQNTTTVWVSSNAERLSSEPGKPWYEAKRDIDVWDEGQYRVNAQTGRLCIEYLRAYAGANRSFLFFLHFREPDHAGHQHGENSPEYEAALIDDDVWLGRIRETLRELGVGATAAVFVVSDHGFDEGKNIHRNAPDAWLATNWYCVKRGGQEDVAPTILSAFGIDLSGLSPPLPGEPLWVDRDPAPSAGDVSEAARGWSTAVLAVRRPSAH